MQVLFIFFLFSEPSLILMELSDFVVCVREEERFNGLHDFLCSPMWISTLKYVRKHECKRFNVSGKHISGCQLFTWWDTIYCKSEANKTCCHPVFKALLIAVLPLPPACCSYCGRNQASGTAWQKNTIPAFRVCSLHTKKRMKQVNGKYELKWRWYPSL